MEVEWKGGGEGMMRWKGEVGWRRGGEGVEKISGRAAPGPPWRANGVPEAWIKLAEALLAVLK